MVACDGVSKHPGIAGAAVGAMLYGGFAAIDRLFLGRRFNLLEARKLLPSAAVLVALGLIGEGVVYCARAPHKEEESDNEIELIALAGSPPLPLSNSVDAGMELFLTLREKSEIARKAQSASDEELYGLVKHADEEQFKAIIAAVKADPKKLIIILKALAQEVTKEGVPPEPTTAKLALALELAMDSLSLTVITTIHPKCLIPRLREGLADKPEALKVLAALCCKDEASFEIFLGEASPEAIDAMMEVGGEFIHADVNRKESILWALYHHLTLWKTTYKENTELKEYALAILGKALNAYPLSLPIAALSRQERRRIDQNVREIIADHVTTAFCKGQWSEEDINKDLLKTLCDTVVRVATDKGNGLGEYHSQLVRLARHYQLSKNDVAFDYVMSQFFLYNLDQFSDIEAVLELAQTQDGSLEGLPMWLPNFRSSLKHATFEGWDEEKKVRVIEKAEQLVSKYDAIISAAKELY